MDFSVTEREKYWRDRVVAFMDRHVYPNIETYEEQTAALAGPLADRPDPRGAEGEGEGGGAVEPVHAAAPRAR